MLAEVFQDPAQLAQTAGAAMYARDAASQAMGMALADIAPGRAVMTMTVRHDMLNGHASCHGGFLFALADSAFAFACNSYNYNTVGVGCTIDYLAPGKAGDVLTATATEQSRSGKSGVYDVIVRNQDGVTLVLLRGRSRRVPGQLVGTAGRPVESFAGTPTAKQASK